MMVEPNHDRMDLPSYRFSLVVTVCLYFEIVYREGYGLIVDVQIYRYCNG